MAIYQGKTKISGKDFTSDIEEIKRLGNNNTYLQLYDIITGQAYIIQVSDGVINLVHVTGGALSFLLLNDLITGLVYNVQIENKLLKLTEVNGNGKGAEKYDNLYDIKTGILYSLVCENQVLKLEEM